MLAPPIAGLDGETDELFEKAVEVVVQYDRASASLLQRRLDVGYARGARLIEQLEAAGVVGPAEGAKPREVLIRSAEEILGDKSKLSGTKQEDPFEAPASYKLPTEIKFSKIDKSTWGTLFSDIFNRSDFKDLKTEFPLHLGFDDGGKLYTESLLDVKNLIISGNPVSQKETLVDTILLTYLLRYTPKELRFVINDPTHYLDLYNGIPHLLSPVINEHDKVISALRWTQYEMDRRLKQLSQTGVRDIASYNELSGVEGLPYILVITFLDFADIETTDSLTLLTEQGARAGIYNIVVVNRTDPKSLPINIKSNLPARAVFRLTSAGESKSIDVAGAEKLELGEVIYKPNLGNTVNLQAIFTPEINVKEVVAAVRQETS